MTDEEKQLQDQKREKRKRVARMKKMIITVIATWMIVSILLLTFLTIKVISLQRQINAFSENSSEKVSSEETSTESDASDSDLVYNGTTAESNLAEEGDILKVYLTFDDGPSENTSEILDILDDYGIKATFFVTGRDDEISYALYKRIVDEGHTIGMHSYSHQYNDVYASLDSFKNDFSKIQNTIYDATGVECTLYRFPGGSSNKVGGSNMAEYIKYLDSQGVTYYDWNVSSGDATSKAYSADDLVDNVLKDVVKYKTSIVLMHDADSKDTTVEALPKMIEALQAKGALILPISEDTTKIQHVTLATDSK